MKKDLSYFGAKVWELGSKQEVRGHVECLVLFLTWCLQLQALNSRQLSGLLHWPTSWLCSVSTGLAQNNLSSAPVWIGQS